MHDAESMTPAYESPELAEVRRRLISEYDKFKNKSHNQFVYKLSVIECFYLESLTQSDFAKYLLQLKSRLVPLGDGLHDVARKSIKYVKLGDGIQATHT